MNNMFFCKPEKKGATDSSYYYILIVAALVCMYMSLHSYVRSLYGLGLAIPCMLFLGVQQERGRISFSRKYFVLPGIMVAWFLLLQIRRNFLHAELYNIGLFLSVYLFAFPLASVMQEGEGKKSLKIFAGAYVIAASVLSLEGLLLIFDCLPEFLGKDIYWDGGRLVTLWHPNVSGCYFMIGIICCTTFLLHKKSVKSKIFLSILLVAMIGMMALTSCRTATILVGVYFGSIVFYKIICHGRKWFVPAVLAALIVAAVFYTGERYLYQANCDRLIQKYTQEYAEQIASEPSDYMVADTELPLEEAAESEETVIYEETEIVAEDSVQEEYAAEEAYNEDYFEEETDEEEQEKEIPITVDPDTGEVQLISGSMQGDIVEDFGTFNSRTYIWSAAKFAIRDTPSILCWGIWNTGEYVSYYNFFPVSHMHNAWVECLMGMGVVGFLIASMFTLMTVWNCLVILLRHYRDIWKRNTAIVALCLLAASVLEPYVFYTTVSYNLTDFLFFLCAGYLAYWQEEDNRCILQWICTRFHLSKNK